MIFRSFIVAAFAAMGATGAVAEQVCVEEAAGVCLKYKTAAPKKAAPAQPARPAGPTFTSTPEAEVEKSLNLNRNEYRFVQSGLQRAGYYKGGIDGVMGGGSRKALAAWQTDNGVPATGYLTFEQAIALQEGRALQAAVAPIATEVEPDAKTATTPSHPINGEVYREVFFKSLGSTSGDVIAVVERTSPDTAKLTVRFHALNNAGASFRRSCDIPVQGKFDCLLSSYFSPAWRASGTLPDVTIADKGVSFW